MTGKKDQTPASYGSSAFDEKSRRGGNSGESSPVGSNIFIVKPNGKKDSRSHSDPFRHEPVTQQNIGRTILRRIRCKNFDFFCKDRFCIIFSTLGYTTNRKRSSSK
jgi:hypothetical protein